MYIIKCDRCGKEVVQQGFVKPKGWGELLIQGEVVLEMTKTFCPNCVIQISPR